MSTSLPKYIHYCWFGPNELSSLEEMCMDTWKMVMPDFEIVRWDENHLPDLTDVQRLYLETALFNEKWANASDLVRYAVMHQVGGIYLDTDMEVIRHIGEAWNGSDLLLGWESDAFVNVAAMVGKPGNWPCKRCLDLLGQEVLFTPWVRGARRKEKIWLDGNELASRNGPWLMTKVLEEKGLFVPDGEAQGLLFQDFAYWYRVDVVYPRWFYPVSWADRKNNDLKQQARFSNGVLAIHHWQGSWCAPEWK